MQRRTLGKTGEEVSNPGLGGFHLLENSGADASAAIHGSLRRLGTDYVDLLMFHRVQADDELDSILAPGGAMEAFVEARKRGEVRFIGITGHGVPDVLIRAAGPVTSTRS
jgi:aryl-alcohol dehydrogenase-like predicted oxidoreductase